ncbi:MAG: glucose-6-phosphate isomerase [Pirellulaceae bacterium]|nr:glucose-6-phosphate isomerase [Pirellulaceae bacterium]
MQCFGAISSTVLSSFVKSRYNTVIPSGNGLLLFFRINQPPRRKILDPIEYQPEGAFLEKTGISRESLLQLGPSLEAARSEIQADLKAWTAGHPPAPDKDPLDAGFIDLPERILTDYRTRREQSELGRVLATADRLCETVDRVVVLGIGGSYMGARAIMDACCHPMYNELSRADRGSRPRVYFDGNNVDNDATQGLLDVLGQSESIEQPEGGWAIIVVSKSGGTLETAVAFRQFLNRLNSTLKSPSAHSLGDLVVPITGTHGKLHDLAQALQCRDIFRVPNGVGGRFSVLSTVGLLPAAVLGLDVVHLLEGAVMMNERFQTAAVGNNPVLDFAGVCHLLEKERGASTRVLSVWSKGLEAFGLWYDQLLAESLGKSERGALPLTAVNTRDLHSRGQQHQEGVRDKLITNVIVDKYRRDPLRVGQSQWNQDQLNALADKTMPDIMRAAIQGSKQAYRDDNRPTADLHLPCLDEHTLGQAFQMLMLATIVEGRLIGINPYGQPGVEAYKRNMHTFLRST